MCKRWGKAERVRRFVQVIQGVQNERSDSVNCAMVQPPLWCSIIGHWSSGGGEDYCVEVLAVYFFCDVL